MKRSSSAAQSMAPSTTAADASLLLRETLRITAPSSCPPPHPPLQLDQTSKNAGIRLRSASHTDERLDSSLPLICCEEIDGRRWKYLSVSDDASSNSLKFNGTASIRSVCLQTPQNPLEELVSFIRSYVLPEGFPDSVEPSYAPYMRWRALKHFFGGAMSVFTTQSLLNSVGISRDRAATSAFAINWILKDGAGRVGKMIFSRQGKKFDYDLKQLRFSGDLLMELGAGVELATAAMPQLFLPLACVANVLKNVGSVTSTSTRTPIYKAFAKGENIGDVTAKGECVGNIADLLGTGMSITYQEVRSVVLHNVNRARFKVAVESYLRTGIVPSLQEGNLKEKIFTFPWMEDRPVVIDDQNLLRQEERYLVTYNPAKGKVYALLKDQARSDDIVKAAFHGHVLLHSIRSLAKKEASFGKSEATDAKYIAETPMDIEAQVAESCKVVSATYGLFKDNAAQEGWLSLTTPPCLSRRRRIWCIMVIIQYKILWATSYMH